MWTRRDADGVAAAGRRSFSTSSSTFPSRSLRSKTSRFAHPCPLRGPLKLIASAADLPLQNGPAKPSRQPTTSSHEPSPSPPRRRYEGHHYPVHLDHSLPPHPRPARSATQSRRRAHSRLPEVRPASLRLRKTFLIVGFRRRAREDTVRCIVSSLIEEGNELVEELAASDAKPVHDPRGEAENFNDPKWTPDPVDAPAGEFGLLRRESTTDAVCWQTFVSTRAATSSSCWSASTIPRTSLSKSCRSCWRSDCWPSRTTTLRLRCDLRAALPRPSLILSRTDQERGDP